MCDECSCQGRCTVSPNELIRITQLNSAYLIIEMRQWWVVGTRKIREVLISNAHTLIAHLGFEKTLSYLKDNVWWPDIVKDTMDFCRSCTTCERAKASNSRPMCLLKTVDIPEAPWDSIGVDFVGPFPSSQNRHGWFDTLVVVIDHFSSMVHITPSRYNWGSKEIQNCLWTQCTNYMAFLTVSRQSRVSVTGVDRGGGKPLYCRVSDIR